MQKIVLLVLFLIVYGGEAGLLLYTQANPQAAASVIMQANASVAKGVLLMSLRWAGRYDTESDLDPMRVPPDQLVANVKERAAFSLSKLEVTLPFGIGILVLAALYGKRTSSDDATSS